MPVISKQTNKPATKSAKKSGSIVDRISSIEFDEDDGLKLLVYGQSGSGKTTFWSTFPAPILAIICSGGQKTGELRSLNTPEHRKRIKQVVLRETGEMKELIDYLNGDAPFKTVVLDHCSGLQDYTLKEILGLDELPAQKSWGLASQQQYGQSTQQCKEILRGLLNLSINVVLVAQEREFEASEGSEIAMPYVGAALTPSLTGWLAPACDYVVQTYKRPRMVESVTKVGDKEVRTHKRGKGIEYCLRTEPHDVYMTKFRLPKGHKLPDSIVDPTYQQIISIINGV